MRKSLLKDTNGVRYRTTDRSRNWFLATKHEPTQRWQCQGLYTVLIMLISLCSIHVIIYALWRWRLTFENTLY